MSSALPTPGCIICPVVDGDVMNAPDAGQVYPPVCSVLAIRW